MSGPELLTLGLKLDVNRASVDDLEALPGIGPVLAGRIKERAESRPFDSVDDLLFVKGIGPAKLEKIRPFVTVGADR